MIVPTSTLTEIDVSRVSDGGGGGGGGITYRGAHLAIYIIGPRARHRRGTTRRTVSGAFGCSRGERRNGIEDANYELRKGGWDGGRQRGGERGCLFVIGTVCVCTGGVPIVGLTLSISR